MSPVSLLVKVAEREIGTREVGGENCGPRVVEYQRATWLETGPWPWCLGGETEVLSESGWVRLDEISPEHGKVAQVKDDLGIEFVWPEAYVTKPHRGPSIHIRSRSVDIRCDPEHRLYGRTTNWSEHYGFVTAGRMPGQLLIPAAHSVERGVDLSLNEIRLLAAFVADGFFHKKRFIEIAVSKPRKIEYLRELGPRRVSQNLRAYGISRVPMTEVVFDKPDWFDSCFSAYKELRWDFVLRFSREQAATFVKAYAFFDGHRRRGHNVILTKRRQGADVLVALCAYAGWHAASSSIPSGSQFNDDPIYSIRYCETKRHRTIKRRHFHQVEGEITLHCLSVPSGLFLARDSGGRTFLSGNCAAFTAWCIREWLAFPDVRAFFGIKDEATAERWRPKTASVFDMEKWARDHGQMVLPETEPARAGDLVIFDFSHIGIVIRDETEPGWIETVEGNTNGAGSREGDGVWRKRRPKHLVKCLIRWKRSD